MIERESAPADAELEQFARAWQRALDNPPPEATEDDLVHALTYAQTGHVPMAAFDERADPYRELVDAMAAAERGEADAVTTVEGLAEVMAETLPAPPGVSPPVNANPDGWFVQRQEATPAPDATPAERDHLLNEALWRAYEDHYGYGRTGNADADATVLWNFVTTNHGRNVDRQLRDLIHGPVYPGPFWPPEIMKTTWDRVKEVPGKVGKWVDESHDRIRDGLLDAIEYGQDALDRIREQQKRDQEKSTHGSKLRRW